MLIKTQGRRRREWQMVGCYHQLNGHDFEQTPGYIEGQGSLDPCCSPWDRKGSDTTEWLNNIGNRLHILSVGMMSLVAHRGLRKKRLCLMNYCALNLSLIQVGSQNQVSSIFWSVWMNHNSTRRFLKLHVFSSLSVKVDFSGNRFFFLLFFFFLLLFLFIISLWPANIYLLDAYFYFPLGQQPYFAD